MPAFYHLSTADGLSDNSVNSVCRDRNGIVWIGTTEGLNSFNGNTITTYYKEQYPLLPDNSIEQVVCDNDNDIWLRTSTPFLLLLDKQRRFIQYPVGNGQSSKVIDQLIVTKSRGVIAMKGKSHFIIDKKQQRLIPFAVDGDSLLPSNSGAHNHIDEDKVIFFGNHRIVIVDYAKAKVLMNMRVENIAGAAAINDSELIAYPRAGRKLYRIDIPSKQITTVYDQLVDQNGQPLGSDLRNIQRAGENNFIITSRFAGVFHFNITTQKLQRWYHDPVDTRSIGGDNTSSITYDTTGYVFIGTRTSGLHYFNTNRQSAGYRSYFRDTKGILFDGFIQAICTSNDDNIWLGTQDRLIRWNRRTNETAFVDYFLPQGRNLNGDETVRALSFDNEGRLWIGTTRNGILLLDSNQKTIAQYAYDSLVNGIKFPSNWINAITRRNENETWIATLNGICIIDPKQKSTTDLVKHLLPSKIGKRFCYTVWFDSKKRIWIGSSDGAWCYDESTGQLQQYDQKNGLPDNRVLCFNEDNAGNIYAGTFSGLAIISPNGKTETYDRSNGLRNNKCEGILKDHEGFLWIGNLNCILRFDPKSKKFAAFEEGWGFSHAGFRMRSCFQNTNGEMFWGSDKGFTWFMPQMMNQLAGGLHPTIHGLTAGDSAYRFTGTESISFPYHSRSFNFQFSSGELTAGNRIQFLCRLRGFEKEWKHPSVPGQASYNNLPPGKYHFEIKASRDGDNWYEGAYPVTIVIDKPWWQQTWFR
ncbi:MAG TPA: two-component regulator propeller domain-containing protein, partial [Chitinophagaceae bacterium]|nr:two-component regulator propeller domain-containing protein [Chitinophagaceae bacterium]